MRPETKAKLDALQRREMRKRVRLYAIVALVISAAAFLYFRPSTAVAQIPATVERSVTGVDHWGQKFHQLSAKLTNGRVVQVQTFLLDHPLKLGQRVTLTQYQNAWGGVFYRLHPRDTARASKDR